MDIIFMNSESRITSNSHGLKDKTDLQRGEKIVVLSNLGI